MKRQDGQSTPIQQIQQIQTINNKLAVHFNTTSEKIEQRIQQITDNLLSQAVFELYPSTIDVYNERTKTWISVPLLVDQTNPISMLDRQRSSIPENVFFSVTVGSNGINSKQDLRKKTIKTLMQMKTIPTTYNKSHIKLYQQQGPWKGNFLSQTANVIRHTRKQETPGGGWLGVTRRNKVFQYPTDFSERIKGWATFKVTVLDPLTKIKTLSETHRDTDISTQHKLELLQVVREAMIGSDKGTGVSKTRQIDLTPFANFYERFVRFSEDISIPNLLEIIRLNSLVMDLMIKIEADLIRLQNPETEDREEIPSMIRQSIRNLSTFISQTQTTRMYQKVIQQQQRRLPKLRPLPKNPKPWWTRFFPSLR